MGYRIEQAREAMRRPFETPGQRCAWRTVFVSAIVLLVLIIKIEYDHSRYVQHYAVVIDAGSVHTTLQLYQYPTQYPINASIGKVEQILSCEVSSDTGISTLNSPNDVKNLLYSGACWSKVANFVDDDFKINETLNVVGGTSGMRQLELSKPRKARRIINFLNQELKSNFSTGSEARILKSSEEGKYGWLSTNYLLHGPDIDLSNQVGSLDWGGGSAEITFATDIESSDEVKLFNRSFNIFTRSDECYGQHQALIRYYTLLIKEQVQTIGSENIRYVKLQAPCQPRLSIFNVTHQDLKSKCSELKDLTVRGLLHQSAKFTFVGSSNHSECQRITEKLFNRQECKSTFKTNCFKKPSHVSFRPKQFYAFSTYFYTASNLNVQNGHLILQEWRQKSEDLCSQSYHDHPLASNGEECVRNECFRSVFMNTLLEKGYGFNTSQTQIKMVETVNGQNVDWTLGYLLDEYVREIPIEDEKWPYHWWYCYFFYFALGCSFLFLSYHGGKWLYYYCKGVTPPPSPEDSF